MKRINLQLNNLTIPQLQKELKNYEFKINTVEEKLQILEQIQFLKNSKLKNKSYN